MSQYRYDVAISFAGEQRSIAEELATSLAKAGIKVFYDDFEKATLWGRNLYDHLSDVYQNQAKYCIILASKEYLEKAWTTHERQSAQARAFSQEKSDYILPVKIDSTAITGVLPTIGYLEYEKEGVEGICNAFLRKIDHPSGTQVTGIQSANSKRKKRSNFAIFIVLGIIVLIVIIQLKMEHLAPFHFPIVPNKAIGAENLANINEPEDEFIKRYVNTDAAATNTGHGKWAVVLRRPDGNAPSPIMAAANKALADKGITIAPIFRNGILQETPYKQLYGADSALLYQLHQLCDGVIVGEVTSTVSTDPDLQNLVTVRLNINVRVFLTGSGTVKGEFQLSQKGGGFSKDTAYEQASERLTVNFKSRLLKVFQ